MRRADLHRRVLQGLLLIAGAVAATMPGVSGIAAAQGQSIVAFEATPPSVFIATPTIVTFRATIPASPTVIPTSANLQRLSGATWTNAGPMYDDGTHGDAVAGDSVYSAQVSINQATPGAVSFRGSVALRGQLLRDYSNIVDVMVVTGTGLSIEAGSHTVSLMQAEQQNVASVITLVKQAAGLARVTNVVSVTPDNGGLTVTSDYPAGGYTTTATGSISFVLNQAFRGLTPGTYSVTNTVTLEGSSPPFVRSDTITVQVLPPGGNPTILPLGSDPDGVQIAVPTSVTFTAQIASYLTAPGSLSLRRVGGASEAVVGLLRDDGQDGDLQAGDGIYSGSAVINEPAEGTVRFRTSGLFPGVPDERFSDVFSVIATCHAPTLRPPDMTKVVTSGGEAFLSNEVLVTFAAGTTCAQRNQVAEQVGGTIVGTQPGLGIYQIAIPNPGGTAQGVQTAIATLLAQTGVTSATPNLVGSGAEVVPNDPSFGLQYGPKKIRADEAWVIARGGPVVAVLDTGVDYNHPDLSGKVIKGHDFVTPDSDPMDDHGHGTLIAGIIGANSNNGIGIAGIAWDSNILAIKSSDSSNSLSAANGAAAIKKAADQGAKIINASWGFDTSPTVLKNAVDYAVAKGAIVVATAGNAGANVLRYPCAYANVFCVGSTTSSDSKSGFSNFGSHVDIAAPGSAIYSTALGGSYASANGTSFAAPHIAGAVAVVWSRFPSKTAAEIRTRLEKTAVPLTGAQLGAGRVDLFEAVFNGSFEFDIDGWEVTGTAGAVPSLGEIVPTNRTKMGFGSSGPDAAQIETTLLQDITIQPGVTSLPIKFDYNFVTEEYPEWVGRGYNDDVRIVLVAPDGTETLLAFESVDGSSFTLVGGIDFPGGDATVGETGWKAVSKVVPVTSGPGVYRIVVRDRGDGIYDSNILIDNIRFR